MIKVAILAVWVPFCCFLFVPWSILWALYALADRVCGEVVGIGFVEWTKWWMTGGFLDE